MKYTHQEKAIETIVDGKKFVTYEDSYEEDLGEFLCPNCQTEMVFNQEYEITGQGTSDLVNVVKCKKCSFSTSCSNESQNDYFFVRTVKGLLVAEKIRRLE